MEQKRQTYVCSLFANWMKCITIVLDYEYTHQIYETLLLRLRCTHSNIFEFCFWQSSSGSTHLWKILEGRKPRRSVRTKWNIPLNFIILCMEKMMKRRSRRGSKNYKTLHSLSSTHRIAITSSHPATIVSNIGSPASSKRECNGYENKLIIKMFKKIKCNYFTCKMQVSMNKKNLRRRKYIIFNLIAPHHYWRHKKNGNNYF